MSRLPIPGSDKGTWGEVLNDFLFVEHNSDGSLKPGGSLQYKAPINNPTFTGSVTVPSPASPTDAVTKYYVDNLIAASVPDATALSKGIIQLSGDLSGTATSPKIANDAIINANIASGANISQSKISSLTSDLANKVDSGDSRLSDSRIPVAHATSHGDGGTDEIAISESQVTGLSATISNLQPLDSDLTAIAALGTTSFGRNLLALADASAGRAALSLGTASTHADSDYATSSQGAKADSALQPVIIDAKGDLLIGSADNSISKLTIGTTDQVLTVESGTAAWKTPISITPTFHRTVFNFTGSQQSFNIPSTVTVLNIELSGASGGYDFSGIGDSAAAKVTGQILNKQGQTIYIFVGGMGENGTGSNGGDGGWNGGGSAGKSAGGGGGASDIRFGGVTPVDRIAVAAGSGGAGANGLSYGGYGGTIDGSDGINGSGSGGGDSGGGATQLINGSGGSGGAGVDGGTGDSSGNGGNGGNGGDGSTRGGGGGGGGFRGGGGGEGGSGPGDAGGGGGGGSSLLPDNGSSDLIYSSLPRDGYAIFTWIE